MASTKVHGITIELDANTTGVTKAFNDINKQVNSTASELKTVEKMLKLDPSNTVLLAQKQKLLADAIKGTNEKLVMLNKAQEEANNSDEIDKNSKAYRQLERDIEATKSKLSSFSEQTEDISENLGSASTNALSFGDVLKANVVSDVVMSGLRSMAALTKQVASAFINIIKEGVDYNATMEGYATSFTAMLGSGEKATDLLDRIRKSASSSPFDVESLVQANQALLTTGINAEDAEKTIKALGDAVAYTGGGNSELTRMASNLQQVKNVGKASAMDIRQFAMAGIDIYGILSAKMGVTTEQIKDMDISYEDLSEALIRASEEGGKYFGAMERQADTFTGQVNKLQSNWSMLTGVIAEDATSALKEDFLPSLNDALEKTIQWKENGFGSLGEAIASGMVDVAQTFIEKAPDLIDGGFEMIKTICDGLMKEEGNGKSRLENTMYDLTDSLIKSCTDGELAGKLTEVGVAMAKGIASALWDNFMAMIQNARDLYNAQTGEDITIQPIMRSGGFNGLASGGFASGGITMTNNFTINNANNVTQAQVQQWSSWLAESVNERLGEMI